jgi:hypothetical protein
MYCITDEQVDFILDDIRRNGIEMEDLQLNLLDHICCIIEQNLEDDGDFEDFYRKTVRQFYKKELREIEAETIQLLTFKNYYAMRKTMIVSGTLSAGIFALGSIFKVMHWPGAAVMLVLGVIFFSFLFLPLMLLMKIKETSLVSDKLVMSSATLTGICFCLACMFTVQHWPGATNLWYATVGLSFFVLIPIYFFTGIRREGGKVNAIVTTTLLTGATACLFLMINTRPSYRMQEVKMYSWLQSEQLLQRMQGANTDTDKLAADINRISMQIKSLVLQNAIGMSAIPDDFERQGIFMEEGNTGPAFKDAQSGGTRLIAELKEKIKQYNAQHSTAPIPVAHTALDAPDNMVGRYSNYTILNTITQLQLYVVSAPHTLVATK